LKHGFFERRKPMKIVLFGAGKMAYAIAYDLVRRPEISQVVIGDIRFQDAEKLAQFLKSPKAKPVRVDATDYHRVLQTIKNSSCVIGSTTYAHNLLLTKACLQARTNFCDLGGNIYVVEKQRGLSAQAKKAGVTVIPDCGLAPGMVNVLAYHWAKDFDSIDRLKIRVGGLPQKPKNLLNYQLVFSVEGLINEYIEDAVILGKGRKQMVPSLTGVEELSFPKPFQKLEAFYTSGGSSTLPETLKGKVKNLDYKTIRYPGHSQFVKFMLDLGLVSSQPVQIGQKKIIPRQLSAYLLTRYLPANQPDVVLIRIQLEGKSQGKFTKRTYDSIDYYDRKTRLTSMQRTTGFPVAIIAQMLASGRILQKGVIPQELAVPGKEFIQELNKRNISFIKK
jgi:lysine 6-dehydrogenase